jgi:hypothetical protein
VNAEFSPLGALFLVAWLAAGGFAVFTFVRQSQPTFRHWVSLIVGVVMLALGAWNTFLDVWLFLRIRR